MPSTFLIETVLGCNLRCPGCSWGNKTIKRKSGSMSFEQYKIIADKIKPYAKRVYLINWGEPLLNNDIIKIINYTSHFAKASISTNAQLLTPELAEKLINSGLHDLIISIDGITQEVYEKYRKGGSVKKAIESLELLDQINKTNGNKVKLIPQFIVFKHNEHEMEEFEKKCHQLGLEPYFKEPYIQKNSGVEISSIERYKRKHYKDLNTLRKVMRGCIDLKSTMTILLDGTIVPCCYDSHGQIKFGNIFKEELLEIWDGSISTNFRKNLYNGNTPSFCVNNCLLYNYDNKNNIASNNNKNQ
ncbi:radical SAM protein [Patescibacteria group bacterium]|nr:radical SAM protein [Patescibacteria group bacterium]MBU4026651.1 radical SAM protein [Patescibacteria group bacterium]